MTTTAPSTTATPTTHPAGRDALTADGGIHLRPVRPADEPALAALYRRASTDSLRMRFVTTPGRANAIDPPIPRGTR